MPDPIPLPLPLTAAELASSVPQAHICANGRLRPFPSVACSACRDPVSRDRELSVFDLVGLLNEAYDEIDRLRAELARRESADVKPVPMNFIDATARERRST